MRRAFRSRLLLPDVDTGWVEDALVLVDDGYVVYAGRYRRDLVAGYELVDLGRSAVIPGLVNAHTHVAMVLLRGLGDGAPLHEWLRRHVWPIESSLSERDIYYGNVAGVAELLMSGVTCFADFYNIEPMLEVLERVPMRALLTLAFMDEVEYMREVSWRRLEEVSRYKLLVESRTNGRARLALGPHAPYSCSPDLLKRVGEKAVEHRVPIHIHLSETREDVELSIKRFGARPVEYLNSLGLLSSNKLIAAHGVHLDEREVELIASSDCSVVHCPRSNSRLGSGVIDLPRLLRRGVNVALGTDGPASSDSMNMLEEMRVAVYLQRAVSQDPGVVRAPEVLRASTTGGAKALGFKDVGRVAAGYRADFVVFDLDSIRLNPSWSLTTNLVMSATDRDIKAVVVNGDLVVEGGSVKIKMLEGALEKIREVVSELLPRR